MVDVGLTTYTTPKFESVWDTLIDEPDEGLKKKSGYSILIQARLHGQSGSEADKAKQFGLQVDHVHDLVSGRINEFNLSQLIAIARKGTRNPFIDNFLLGNSL